MLPRVHSPPCDSSLGMQLYDTNGTLSWQQSKDFASSLGGRLPTLTELTSQLSLLETKIIELRTDLNQEKKIKKVIRRVLNRLNIRLDN